MRAEFPLARRDCAKVPRRGDGKRIVEDAVAARGVIQLAVGFELGEVLRNMKTAGRFVMPAVRSDRVIA